MATNRYTQITPSTFNPLSVQEVMMVPLAKQRTHEMQQAALSQAGIFDVNRLPTDDPYIKEQIGTFKNRISGIEDELMNNGVSRGLVKKVMDIKADREFFLSNDGPGGQAQAQYNAYKANQDWLQKQYIAGKISAGKYERGLNQALTDYDRTGGIQTGGRYQDFAAVQDTDYMKAMEETANWMSKNARVRDTVLHELGFTRRGDMYVNIKENLEYTIDDAIKLATLARVYNDEGMMEDLRQRESLNLLGGRSVDELLDETSSFLESTRAIDNRELFRTLNAVPGAGSGDKVLGDDPYISSGVGRQRFFAEYGSYADLKEKSKTSDRAKADLSEFRYKIRNSEDYQRLNQMKQGIIKNMFTPSEGVDITEENMEKISRQLASVPEIEDNTAIAGQYIIEDGILYRVKKSAFDSEVQANRAMKNLEAYGVKEYTSGSHKEGKGLLQQGKLEKLGTMKNLDQIGELTDRMNNLIEDKWKSMSKGQEFIYTPQNLSEPLIKKFNKNFRRNLIAGGTTNFEILDISGGEAAQDLRKDLHDPDKNEVTTQKIFDEIILSKGNMEFLSLKNDIVAGIPSAQVSIVVDDETYRIDIGLDKLRNYDNISSIEEYPIRFVENLGGKEAERVAEDMRFSIQYQNINTLTGRNKFDSGFSKTYKSDLFSKSTDNMIKSKLGVESSDDYSVNIYKQDGTLPEYKVAVKRAGSDDIEDLNWGDLFSSDEIDFINSTDGQDFKKKVALLGYALDQGHLDSEDLGDQAKVNEVLSEIVSDGEYYPIEIQDKYELFELLSS